MVEDNLIRLALEDRLRDHADGERAVEYPFVLDQLPTPPAKVLDVGCRFSPLSGALAEVGYDVTGVDVGPWGAPGVRFIQADARDLSALEDYFDVVLCISTIEHIGLIHEPYGTTDLDPDGDLKALWEMAEKGRMIIVTFPVGEGDREWFGHSDWIRFYDPARVETMLRLLKAAEFACHIEFSQWDKGAKAWFSCSAGTAYGTYSHAPDGLPQANCRIAGLRV